MFSTCPQKTRETGRVIIQQVSATHTLQALVTSESAFMDATSFLNVRSIFPTMCQTAHISCPQTELDPFPSKSVASSVVPNSVNCPSFTQGPRPETPGLPMTFPTPQLLSQWSPSVLALMSLESFPFLPCTLPQLLHY